MANDAEMTVVDTEQTPKAAIIAGRDDVETYDGRGMVEINGGIDPQ